MQNFKEFIASGPAFVATSKSRGTNSSPHNPYADPENDHLTEPNIISIQNVRAGRVFDARCLEMNPESKKKAIEAMVSAVRGILIDGTATVSTVAPEDVHKFGRSVTWGQLYPNAIPFENGINIEYWQTATRNILGRMGWSANNVTTSPLQVAMQKAGLDTSPEHFYEKQFENELAGLANQKILIGWPQNWKTGTTIFGRDIKLLLKQPEII